MVARILAEGTNNCAENRSMNNAQQMTRVAPKIWSHWVFKRKVISKQLRSGYWESAPGSSERFGPQFETFLIGNGRTGRPTS
jgi:uncharacterized cupin superfamily protein